VIHVRRDSPAEAGGEALRRVFRGALYGHPRAPGTFCGRPTDGGWPPFAAAIGIASSTRISALPCRWQAEANP